MTSPSASAARTKSKGLIEALAKRAEGLDQQLAKRAAELEATNKELESFAYSVSHDLRAPLRHTAGFAELLQRQASSSLDDKGRRYVEMILESSKRMGNLIDDLLGFSRIGRAETKESAVDLERLVAEVVAELGQETKGSGHCLEYRAASGLLRGPFHAESGPCEPAFQCG